VQPQQPKARVRARIITSPQHMKRLLGAIQENVARYERAFGTIEIGHLPEGPIH
jgi:elongation factor P--beta-lysine ligase